MATPRRTPCCEVMWKIQNFSCCCYQKGGYLDSPSFRMDSLPNIRWILSLNVTTYCEDNIRIYLHEDEGEYHHFQLMKYELAVLDNDNHVFNTKTLESYSFSQDDPSFNSKYLRPAFLLQNKKTVLLRDELTIRCRIWKDEETSFATSFLYLTTNIWADKCHFPWKINYRNCVDDDFNETVQFEFTFNKSKSIKVVLSYLIHKKRECIKIVLDYDIKSSYILKCIMRIAETQELFFASDIGISKESLPPTYLYAPNITRETILKSKELILENEYLILDCELVLVPKDKKIEFSCKTSSGKSTDKATDTGAGVINCSRNGQVTVWNSGTENEKIRSVDSITVDLENILRSGHSSDFTLRVEQKRFPVHSAILAARSPVFKNMLESDMKEKLDRIAEIEDLDIDTVAMMLNYLYANNPGDLTVKNAMKLYYAAEKYEIKSLKVLCSSYLERRFTIENVFDLIEMSDRHSDQELFQKAVDFVNAFRKEIIQSEAFEKFKERNAKCAWKVVSMLLELAF